jgi:hypothetical protein
MQPSSSIFDILITQNANRLPVMEHLKQIAYNHPYFTPAQFFLLQQMETSHSEYPIQVSKTAVLFNNPHWLHFQLQPEKKAADIIENKTAEIVSDEEKKSEEIAIVEENSTILTANGVDTTTTDDMVFLNTKEDSESERIVEAAISTTVSDSEFLTPVSNVEEEIKPVIEEKQPSPIENTTDPDDTDGQENENEPLREMPALKIDLNAPVNEALLFEPLHMVDYFRSQGIKLNEELQPADKLGRQLKSFTEWLKTMKKIHVADSTAVADQSDSAIQAMAEKSNADNEILTEAMAAVLASQGKAEKAAELYQKLSLLNPTKSAYFAAKIEQLKDV